MLNDSWTDRVSNEELYRRIKEKKSVETTISRKRSKKWIGRLMRYMYTGTSMLLNE